MIAKRKAGNTLTQDDHNKACDREVHDDEDRVPSAKILDLAMHPANDISHCLAEVHPKEEVRGLIRHYLLQRDLPTDKTAMTPGVMERFTVLEPCHCPWCQQRRRWIPQIRHHRIFHEKHQRRKLRRRTWGQMQMGGMTKST